MYYYTYYTYEEWGRGYIGSRGSKVSPEQDTRYMGSFKDKTFKPTQKIILASHYKTREEAIDDEIILQTFFQVVSNPHFANRAYQTSNKFILEGELATQVGKEKWAKYTKEERSELIKKWFSGISPEKKSQMVKEGWDKLTAEQRSERAKKRSLGLTSEQRAENQRKIMAEHRKNGTGAFAVSLELKRERGRKQGLLVSSQRWQCTETGYIGSAGVLALYQRARGIDTTKRIRLS